MALVLGFGMEAEEMMGSEVLWRLNLGSLNRGKVLSFSVWLGIFVLWGRNGGLELYILLVLTS